MSIEGFLAEQNKNKPRQFKDVVGRLLLEKESEDTRPWKWEEEITENDWLEMMNELKKPQHLQNPMGLGDYFLRFISSIHLIFPTHKLPIDKEKWEKLSKPRIEPLNPTFFMYLIDAPHAPCIEDRTWMAMEKKLSRLYESELITDFLSHASRMHVLKPNNIIHVEEHFWKQIEKKIEHYSDVGEWYAFTAYAFEARLLDPTRTLFFNKQIWENLSEHLEKLRHDKRWFMFCCIASWMRVIAANQIELTKDGMLITDKSSEKLDTEIPPRPVRKKI